MTIHVGDRVFVMIAGEPQPASVVSVHHLDDYFDAYVVRPLDQPPTPGCEVTTRTPASNLHRRLRLRDRGEPTAAQPPHVPAAWQREPGEGASA